MHKNDDGDDDDNGNKKKVQSQLDLPQKCMDKQTLLHTNLTRR